MPRLSGLLRLLTGAAAAFAAVTLLSLFALPLRAQPLSITWEVPGHPQPAAIARSASGIVAYMGDKGDLILLRDSGTELVRLGRLEGDWRAGVELSPDGELVYARPLYEDYVAAVNIASGERTSVYGPSSPGFVLSRDGRVLAAPYGDILNVWNVADPTHPVVIHGPAAARAIALSDNASLVAAAWSNGTIAFYDPADGAQEGLLQGVGDVDGISLSPNSHVVAGASSASLRLWDTATGDLVNEETIVGSLAPHGFSPLGDLLLIRTPDYNSATLVVHIPDLTVRYSILNTRFSAFDGAGESITACGHLAVYDAQTGAVLRRVAGHAADLRSVRFMPDGERLLAASSDGDLVLWSVAEPSPLSSDFPVGRGDLWCMERSPVGDRIAAGHFWNGPIHIFAWPELKETGKLRSYFMLPTLSFSPDGRRVAHGFHTGDGLGGDTLDGWLLDPSPSMEWRTWTYSGPYSQINIAVSPDGEHVIGGGDRPAIYSMIDGEPEFEVARVHRNYNRVAWPRPGNTVLVLGDVALQMDRAATGEAVAAVSGTFNSYDETLAVDPRGRFTLAAQTDSSLHAWRLPDLRELGSLTSPSLANVTAMDVSPDGRHAAIGRSDGGLVLLNIPDWPLCRADCNDDGRMNINDFICFQARWQRREPYADFDADDAFTTDDLIAFRDEWHRGCE